MVPRKNSLETIVSECKKVMASVLLSSFYLAPVQYYSKLFRAERVYIEMHDTYQKQSYRNRCLIAGANGILPLSIPIEKPEAGKDKMTDIRISDHGNWRHLHWNALVSAYNSTPFFEYYRDDFRPFYEKKYTYLFDFNEELRALICRLLDIHPLVKYTDHFVETLPDGMMDFRETIHPKPSRQKPDPDFKVAPYYQVFRDKYGFLENLSIIDLLFNMGNESRLYL
jgi:hypothetical protein